VTFFSYPSRIRRPRSLCCRGNFRVPFRVRKLESWGYTVVKIAWSYLEPSLTDPPVWQTDGRTDGQTARRTGVGKERAIAYMLSRAKKNDACVIVYIENNKIYGEPNISQFDLGLLSQKVNFKMSFCARKVKGLQRRTGFSGTSCWYFSVTSGITVLLHLVTASHLSVCVCYFHNCKAKPVSDEYTVSCKKRATFWATTPTFLGGFFTLLVLMEKRMNGTFWWPTCSTVLTIRHQIT